VSKEKNCFAPALKCKGKQSLYLVIEALNDLFVSLSLSRFLSVFSFSEEEEARPRRRALVLASCEPLIPEERSAADE